jgi:hypothetical protein
MTVIEEHDGDCRHGVYPAMCCTLCNGNEARRRAESEAVLYSFPAHYDGTLACGHYARMGDIIAKRADGTYVCESCIR